MAFLNLGSIGPTEAVAVADQAAGHKFDCDKAGKFSVHANRVVHVATDVQATESDFRLEDIDYVAVDLQEGQFLSFILADGETAGTVYITAIA